MEDNPFVDEHTVRVRAAPEDVWPVLAARLARWSTGFAPAYGTLIGVHPGTATGTLPEPGATLPGFAVTTSVGALLLILTMPDIGYDVAAEMSRAGERIESLVLAVKGP